jgi:NAD(P)-dependent dehydrogenase (short-subunit alcohol dehydrogenase family)
MSKKVLITGASGGFGVLTVEKLGTFHLSGKMLYTLSHNHSWNLVINH